MIGALNKFNGFLEDVIDLLVDENKTQEYLKDQPPFIRIPGKLIALVEGVVRSIIATPLSLIFVLIDTPLTIAGKATEYITISKKPGELPSLLERTTEAAFSAIGIPLLVFFTPIIKSITPIDD